MKADKIELLSPSGDMECVIAAVKAGADAVYLGWKLFGARSSSKNFTIEELKEAIRYCHIRGVKVYVTVNTLIFNDEIKKLLKYIEKLYAMDADALIIQDLGVLAIVKKYFGDFECHASTQITLHNSFGAKAAMDIGIDRVVAAREMELPEIEAMIRNQGTEVEVFIHGALCISYSGQCLMSSVIGGRSGNRGTCAQPCRRQYELLEKTSGQEAVLDNGYLLSTKDLFSAYGLKEIVASGVSSLKIEGRMKSPEYVFFVTRFYRNALAAMEKGGIPLFEPEDMKELAQIFNRKFTKGFLMSEDKGSLVNSESPGNRGVALGTAKAEANGKIYILLKEPLSLGDGIQFRRGSESYGCRIDNRNWYGNELEAKVPGETFEIENRWRMKGVYEAFKTHDSSMERRLAIEMNKADKRVPLRMEVRAILGEPFRISFKDGDGRKVEVLSEYIVQEAAKRPTGRVVMEEKLGRLGATAYSIEESVYEMDDGIYVPVSILNETRRKAADFMDDERAVVHTERKPVEILKIEERTAKPYVVERKVSVTARTISQVKVALSEGADRIYFKGAENLDEVLGLSDKVVYSPFKISGDREIKEMLLVVERLGLKEIQVGNLGQMRALRDSGMLIHGDFSLNVANDYSIRLLEETFPELETVCLSPEMNLSQIKGLSQSVAGQEMIVYGRLPVMTLNHCPLNKSFGVCLENDCENRKLSLRDAKGYEFPMRLKNCHAEIFNSVRILTAARLLESPPENVVYWRMELLDEDFDTACRLIRFHKRAIVDGDIDWQYLEELKQSDYTRGHFFKSGV
ncbi:MAG: U32 family peptidase [Peptostreptococcaceae bacterium]|nr:U32 family peptidase [Peptostreptococcaceae bacterium]